MELLPPVTVGPESFGIVIKPSKKEHPPLAEIRCVLRAQISVEKSGLPPSLLSRVKHLACLHNPEFHKKQKLRLSTYGTPRFVKCYGEDLTHLHLPRGLLSELKDVMKQAGSRPYLEAIL
ncbi:hypothetical protein HZA56_08185 [Candidatus Poribacteria bacterium]|nr:hypothetical protein [Candidatus Poribacteria bacterium]